MHVLKRKVEEEREKANILRKARRNIRMASNKAKVALALDTCPYFLSPGAQILWGLIESIQACLRSRRGYFVGELSLSYTRALPLVLGPI